MTQDFSDLSRDELIARLRAVEAEPRPTGSDRHLNAEQFRRYYERIHMGVLIQDRSGRIRHANHVACRIMGRSLEELLGATSHDSRWQMVDENGRPVGTEEHPSMVTLRTGEPVRGVVRGLLDSSENGTRWLLIHTEPLMDDSTGAVQEVLVSFSDITAQKQSEKALERSRQRLQIALDAAGAGLWVCDVQRRFAQVDARAWQILGLEDSQSNMPFDEYYSRWSNRLHPDDRDSAQSRGWETLETGQPYEVDYRVGDDANGWRWVHSAARLVRDKDGHPHFLVGLLFDVTDRRRQQEALAAGEEKYRLVAENTTDCIWQMRLDETYLYINPACERIFGYTTREYMQTRMEDHYQPGELARVRRFAQKLLEERNTEPFDFETVLHHKDGTPVPVEVTGRLILDQHGEPLRFQGVTRDISARKAAEEERHKLEAQVQHAQKLESLGVLAGGIAHDFNNLLMGILGNADLAMAELSPLSPARQSVEEIEKASRHAADLCRQMLAYSGRGQFVIEPIDLSELVHEMAHMLEVSITKNAVLRYDFATALPAVRADATQIRQIVMNLITNASEAIKDRSGVVSLATGAMYCDREYLETTFSDLELAPGLYVTLEVSDTGCGMNAETVARVFDPFFSTKFTGRGLGLAAVLGIVRSHHGAVKVYSEPDKGTTFKVLLPAVEEPAPAPADHKPACDTWRPGGTVLLADDEETVRAVGRRMLEKLGFDVITAGNGREAVDVFRRRREEMDAIILDLTMPGLTGEEAFRELRRLKAAVPVLMSSGYNEHEVTQRFVGKGLAGFIQKPYHLDQLHDRLRAAMEPPSQ
ncbi:MAG: PAS domain S-box protein [Phycisphaerae bacterium]